MIFCAKNEDGVPTWKLVLEGKKTVTRRLKPMSTGKEFAIQPGRGKKAVAKGKVIDCKNHIDWCLELANKSIEDGENYLDTQKEAEREGFNSWIGLFIWLREHRINIDDTYRIEFEVIKKTSEEWVKNIPKKFNLIILDPDGWDRKNFKYSFYEELITGEEFEKRVSFSTVQASTSFFKGGFKSLLI